MRRTFALAAVVVTGASMTWCKAFDSSGGGGGASGDAAAVDAPNGRTGDRLIACQTADGNACPLPQVCCLTYSGVPDSCIARPTVVTGSCGAGFTDLTRIAECDDEDDCDVGKVCCKIAPTGNASLLCIPAASCDAGAGERLCDISKNDCPAGSTCAPLVGSPYASCQ